MERPNKTIRKSTKHNGSGKDTSNQTTRNREVPKNKRSFDFTTFSGSQSIAEILREMDSQIKKLGTNQEKQINTLNEITSKIKSVDQNIDDIRENYL
jgi:uncharacterized protein Yka (UPF0111/DUF47 family)